MIAIVLLVVFDAIGVVIWNWMPRVVPGVSLVALENPTDRSACSYCASVAVPDSVSTPDAKMPLMPFWVVK